MLKAITGAYVFCGGFAVMVLEIIGTLYLAKEFGGSFYVWAAQIGVVLIALACGYAVGGALADRFRHAWVLATPLGIAGLFTILIPRITEPLLEKIVLRHPAGQDIPMIWQKLDPMFGSATVFSAVFRAGDPAALHGPAGCAAAGASGQRERIHLRRQHGGQHRGGFCVGLRFHGLVHGAANFPDDGNLDAGPGRAELGHGLVAWIQGGCYGHRVEAIRQVKNIAFFERICRVITSSPRKS